MTPVAREQQTEEYWKLLNGVIDPELGIGIVDLGLVYGVVIQNRAATVTMTLTSMGCPMGPEIMRRVQTEMARYPNVDTVTVDFVWSPLWTPDRIEPSIRSMLF